MEVDLVGKTGVAAGVGGRQVVDHDRGAVGQDDALPDDERALLAEGDDVVVLADEARALRDEQEPSRDRVVDVLRDLGDDEAGQIRVEPRHQARRDDGAGHQLIGRDGSLQPMLVVDLLLRARLEEGELARLVRGADGGADEIGVAAGQRQRTVGGAQGGQRLPGRRPTRRVLLSEPDRQSPPS